MDNHKNIIQDFYRMDSLDRAYEIIRIGNIGRIYTCEDLVRLGAWDTTRCCTSCHNRPEITNNKQPYAYYNGDVLVKCCCALDEKLSGGKIHMQLLY